MKKELSHINEKGDPKMVNVTQKKVTERMAVAKAIVHLGADVMSKLANEGFNSPKGAIIQTAIIAGNMAVKKTADLIPLCHHKTPCPNNMC